MSEHVLEMRRISKSFPGVKALQDVTLAVARGEVVGLLHPGLGEDRAGACGEVVLGGVVPGQAGHDGEHHGHHDGAGQPRAAEQARAHPAP